MARLAGVDIPRDKRVEVALTYIFGVGRTRALKTLADTEIDGNIRVKDLTDDQLVELLVTQHDTTKYIAVPGTLRGDTIGWRPMHRRCYRPPLIPQEKPQWHV